MGFVIAVDGPAASGKGTIAVKLGALYGYPVLDSGLLYRAVGGKVLESGGDLGDEAAAVAAALSLDPAELERPQVRTRGAGEAASRVAVYTPVRLALRDFQLQFAAREPGAVIDGRDIGTVIAPEAPAKLYITASPEARADSPMKPADDAVLLDTTEMSIDAAFDAARRIVETARSRWETAKG